jgi:hypothetical protein
MAANHRQNYILNKAQKVQYAGFMCRYSSQVIGLNERSLIPEATTLRIINMFV